jgi:hypothetical protein
MKRFPAPWTVEAIDGGFKVVEIVRTSPPQRGEAGGNQIATE